MPPAELTIRMWIDELHLNYPFSGSRIYDLVRGRQSSPSLTTGLSVATASARRAYQPVGYPLIGTKTL